MLPHTQFAFLLIVLCYYNIHKIVVHGVTIRYSEYVVLKHIKHDTLLHVDIPRDCSELASKCYVSREHNFY